MELDLTYAFQGPPERVFDVLTDVSVVAECLPGCENFKEIGENRYKAVLSMGLAAITGRYEGVVELKEFNRPTSYTLVIDGKGRQGIVKGEATIELSAQSEETLVSVKARAKVVGAIARVGQRLLGGAAKVMADRFFHCMQSRAAA